MTGLNTWGTTKIDPASGSFYSGIAKVSAMSPFDHKLSETPFSSLHRERFSADSISMMESQFSDALKFPFPHYPLKDGG